MVKNSMKKFAVCFSLVAFIQNANAQDFNLTDYVSIQLSRVPMDIAVRNMNLDRKSKSASAATAANASSSLSSAILTYSLSPTRSKTNLQNFITSARATNPSGADQIEALSAQHDLLGMMGKGMEAKGLVPNNVAHAMAVYLISVWQVSRGDSTKRSNAEYQAVAAQAARAMSGNSSLASSDDTNKQEMAETFLIRAMIFDITNNQLQADKEQLAQFGQAIAQGAKQEGFDTNAVTLTDKGFVKAGG
jgi:hypothetical protein